MRQVSKDMDPFTKARRRDFEQQFQFAQSYAMCSPNPWQVSRYPLQIPFPKANFAGMVF